MRIKISFSIYHYFCLALILLAFMVRFIFLTYWLLLSSSLLSTVYLFVQTILIFVGLDSGYFKLSCHVFVFLSCKYSLSNFGFFLCENDQRFTYRNLAYLNRPYVNCVSIFIYFPTRRRRRRRRVVSYGTIVVYRVKNVQI